MLIAVLSACSSRISSFAKANRFDKDMYIHIENTALTLYYRSPADINYIKRKGKLKRLIKKTELPVDGEVLIYGLSDYPPYEVSLWISDTKLTAPENLVLQDTLVDNVYFTFVGYPLEEKSQRALIGDISAMKQSMVIGAGFDKARK